MIIPESLSTLYVQTLLFLLFRIRPGSFGYSLSTIRSPTFIIYIPHHLLLDIIKNPTINIIAKINALYPNPGAWFQYKGSRLKIIKAIEVEKKGSPGEIIDKKFTIACSKNAIQILELQKEGKKSINVSEYLKGNILETGINVS